ncbi:hypothetical protein [Streptomyces sp. HUAS TT20]|uniref:hypothetical protein n=1 Tax=Streptomyces sp. HUAS TT20 TaxID=3447509 RepID=UPI0021DA8D0A|nr:hypothetical protein [Streptomyces sp. HUAS 15-9]UXY32909.1 hypothetical protein N8I87_00620 [Streptomyces sp. HUAS 15-9]
MPLKPRPTGRSSTGPPRSPPREDRDADQYRISEHVHLLRTPDHTGEDISTVAGTAEGPVVLTHLWWHAEGPADDPFATDRGLLADSRRAILDLKPVLIIPGNGTPFTPGTDTPV